MSFANATTQTAAEPLTLEWCGYCKDWHATMALTMCKVARSREALTRRFTRVTLDQYSNKPWRVVGYEEPKKAQTRTYKNEDLSIKVNKMKLSDIVDIKIVQDSVVFEFDETKPEEEPKYVYEQRLQGDTLTGADLDRYGDLWGIQRRRDMGGLETDAAYRKRILLAIRYGWTR